MAPNRFDLGWNLFVELRKEMLRESIELPDGFLLWQEFLRLPGTRQRFSAIANLDLTALALLPGIYGLFSPVHPLVSICVLQVLLGSFAYDWRVFYSTSLRGRLELGDRGWS